VSPATQTAAATAEPGRYLYDALIAFLRQDGWPIATEDEAERALAVTVEGTSGRWACAAQILIERPVLLFSSLLPTFVPVPARGRIAEFVTRANAGLVYGGFQFNLDNGELRYVNCLDFTGLEQAAVSASGILEGLIRQMVEANVRTVDQYFSALMAVIHTDVDPAQALAGAENETE
jgi:hypothetical protein